MTNIALLRKKAEGIFRGYLGMTETPPGSNSGPIINAALAFVGLEPGNPWCAAFVCWVLAEAGVINGPKTGSSGGIVAWGLRNGAVVKLPQRGDLGEVKDKNSPTGYRHTVMIVGGWGVYRTLEANEDNGVRKGLRTALSMTCVNPYTKET